MNTLNKALEFQKNNQFEKAHLKYDELGRIEILQLPNISNNPTINRLKYLLCRNRGLLRLRELFDRFKIKQQKMTEKKIKEEAKNNKTTENNTIEINEKNENDDNDIIEIDSVEEDPDDELEISACGEIIGSINDLLNATLYGDPDIKIIQILASLFNHFGHPRLARLCFELKLSNSEDSIKTNEDLKIDLNRPEDLLLNQLQLLENFFSLLNQISDNTSQLYKKVQKCLQYRNFWNDMQHEDKRHKYNWDTILTKSKWDVERSNQSKNPVLVISVVDDIIDLDLFLDDLVNCVPKPKGKNKVLDGYHLTKNIFETVEFDFDVEISKKPVEMETHTGDGVENPDNERKNVIEDANELDGDVVDVPDTTDKSDKESENSNDVIASRAKRTTRTKLEPETNDQAKTKLKNFDIFISQTLPSFLNICGINLHFQSLSKLIISNDPSKFPELDSNVSIFYSCLSNWSDEYTQCLSVMEQKRNKHPSKASNTSSLNENESIREIINLKTSKLIYHNLYKRKDMTRLYAYLKNLSTETLHFDQIRLSVIKFMFDCDITDGSTIYCVEPLGKKTIRNFKNIIDCMSIQLYNEFEKYVLYSLDKTNNKCKILSKFNIAVSIFEVLVDSYLEFAQDQKLKKTSKTVSMDIQNTENILIKRIENWKDIIENAFTLQDHKEIDGLSYVWSRFVWFRLYYLQNHSHVFNPQVLNNVLSQLSTVVKENEIYLPFINCELIPVLNYDNIQTQFSKLKILEIFDKNEASNEILEAVLLNKKLQYNDNDKQNIQSQFVAFVETSNLPLKLRLWSLLLRYYRINNDMKKYKIAFEMVIKTMIDEIKPENMNKLSTHQSKIKILSVIGFFGHFTTKFIHFCNAFNFECFEENARQQQESVSMVKNVSIFFYILQSFLMYQHAVPMDSRLSLSKKSLKSFEILNNCICNCFFLLAFYFPTAVVIQRSELINDFLSVCHIELGYLHLCSSIDGIFLKYLQYKLTKLDFNISANDVFQIIHCRFGLSISLDGYETFDHKCRPVKMLETDAIQLSKFVSAYCFKGKHPVVLPPRNDIKNIIDKIVDVVGNPDIQIPRVAKNKNILDSYLTQTRIDLQFVLDIFQGNFELLFEKPEFVGIEIANDGLYYIEGLIGLHFFKVRKRTMQSRAAELDYVLRMLENDVICGCNRFETWVALGQTYSFLVEDDLVWTADKLNSVERKLMTSLTQKKALLCYSMAVNIHIKSTEEEKLRYKPVIPLLWESFAKELYSAWMEPMNKRAFHIFIEEDMERGKQATKDSFPKVSSLKTKPNDMPTNVILKLLELTFQLAAENDANNWYDLMYLAKTQGKLLNQGYDIKLIIQNLLKACDLALKQSYKDDPIIEPHYYLFSVISKFYRLSKITLEEAVEFFKQDPLFVQLFADNIAEVDFGSLSFKVLYKLISYDKKNWQHRPIYRLAQTYYYVNHDVKKAENQMLTLINLKPNIRSMTTTWKPTSERPGKHFIYNSVYTQFLVQMLYENGDIYSLTILLKKMRRAGSIMVNLTKTFDNMMLRICILIKKSLELEPGFLDESISKIKYSDFVKYSTEFIEKFKSLNTESLNDDTLLHLYFLSETQFFRKLATGFGATGLIDECYHSIYVKMFLPYLFTRLVEDKNGNVLNSELLNKAREFTVDRFVRSKQSSPEVSSRHIKIGNDYTSRENSTNTTPVPEVVLLDNNSTSVDTGSLNRLNASTLSIKDMYSIINYLSFGKMETLGTPSKEKIRVARRDVSPYAMKLVTVTQDVVNSMKEKTNEGETIDYKIKGPLDNTEFEKASIGVMVKETKENKEDKEFDELISAHNRKLNELELEKFNSILDSFNIPKLINSDILSHSDKPFKMEIDTFSKFKAGVISTAGSQDSSADITRNVTPVNVFNEAKIKANSEDIPKSEVMESIATVSSSSPHRSKLTDLLNADNTTTTLSDPSNIDKEDNGDGVIKSPIKIQEGTTRNDDTPSRNLQPSITDFFKTIPGSDNIQPSIWLKRTLEEDENVTDDKPTKRVKPSILKAISSGAIADGDMNNYDTDHNTNNVSGTNNKMNLESPTRRHSTRGSGTSTLMELGKDGGVREQINVKEQRDKALLEEAEIIASSDSEHNSIILLD